MVMEYLLIQVNYVFETMILSSTCPGTIKMTLRAHICMFSRLCRFVKGT